MTWDLDIIERSFADAAIEPTLWGNAMDVISAETGSAGALLFALRGDPFRNTPCSETILKSTEVYFKDGWFACDERFRSIDTIIRRGAADDFAFIDLEGMKKHPYYQEFLRPMICNISPE